jgi:ABC-type uncharacterized transport system substrate-binding protein
MASDLVQRRRWSFVRFLRAASQSDFENVFATLVRQRADALLVSADPFFLSHRDQLVAQAMRQSMRAIYYAREFAAAGVLISYASSFADSFRQAASYVGRLLKGKKAADLPVLQPKAQSQRTFRLSNRRNSNSSSISRPRRPLALRFPTSCSRSPTR